MLNNIYTSIQGKVTLLKSVTESKSHMFKVNGENEK